MSRKLKNTSDNPVQGEKTPGKSPSSQDFNSNASRIAQMKAPNQEDASNIKKNTESPFEGDADQQSTNGIYQQNPDLYALDKGTSVEDLDIVGDQRKTNHLKMSSEKNSSAILDAYEAKTAKEKTAEGQITSHWNTLKALPDPVIEALWAHSGDKVLDFNGYQNFSNHNTKWVHGVIPRGPTEWQLELMEHMVKCGREMANHYWKSGDREETLQELQESLLQLHLRMTSRIHSVQERLENIYGVMESHKGAATITHFFAKNLRTPFKIATAWILDAYDDIEKFRTAVWTVKGNISDLAMQVEISIRGAQQKVDELVGDIASGTDKVIFVLSATEKISLSVFTAWATSGMTLLEQMLVEGTIAMGMNGVKQGAEINAGTRNRFDAKEYFGEGLKASSSKIYTEIGAGGMLEMVKDYGLSQEVLDWAADPASKALMGQIFEEMWNEQTADAYNPDLSHFSKNLAEKIQDEYKGKLIENIFLKD